MKRVYTAPTVTEAHLVKGVLENEGIRSIVKNEHLSGLAGEIPAMESWPEVWVLDDELAERAESILSRFREGGPADHLEY